MYDLNGALAQLGERLHGMQEVSGSSPLCSIKKPLLKTRVFLFCIKISLLPAAAANSST